MIPRLIEEMAEAQMKEAARRDRLRSLGYGVIASDSGFLASGVGKAKHIRRWYPTVQEAWDACEKDFQRLNRL